MIKKAKISRVRVPLTEAFLQTFEELEINIKILEATADFNRYPSEVQKFFF
jgi:hypothetical protein